MDEAREIYGFVVTCVVGDNLTGELFLEMEMAYGFKQSTEELVIETYESLKQYAKENNCQYIKATTNIERAAQLMELGGMKLSSQNYILRIIS